MSGSTRTDGLHDPGNAPMRLADPRTERTSTGISDDRSSSMDHRSDRLAIPLPPKPLVTGTAFHRAVRRVDRARTRLVDDLRQAHVADWCFAAGTVALLAWCLGMAVVVAGRDTRLQIGGVAIGLGILLIVAGPLVRRWETGLCGRKAGPRDALLMLVNGLAALVGGLALVAPAL